MTLAALALTSFGVAFSGAMMPGPMLTLTVAESARAGFWRGPLLVLGHALLEALLLALLYLGLAEQVQRPAAFILIACLGGLLLAWMGAGMLRGLSALSLQLDATGEATKTMHPVLAGALISLANPYFLIWWATIGLGYLAVAGRVGLAGVIVFYLFHILADLVWYAFISGTVHSGRRFLSDRIYRGLVACCALFLIVFGGWFGWQGVTRLFN